MKENKILIKIGLVFLFSTAIFSCKKKEVKNIDYSEIKSQLKRMVQNDQAIQFAHTANETEEVRDSLYKEKDRIFIANTDTVKILFKKHGFLGFNKVGEQGSQDFWLLVQHADHDKVFQQEVLKAMKKEVENQNASNANFAYLTDRVLVNNGDKQLYGTQLNYTKDLWVVPKKMKDSVNVDVRRKEIGLKPLKEYLNSVMEMNYEMNKEKFKEIGITQPKRYK